MKLKLVCNMEDFRATEDLMKCMENLEILSINIQRAQAKQSCMWCFIYICLSYTSPYEKSGTCI